ncbi:MAG: Histone transcription regulator 3 [Piccolia ochrophora]|nr:MAG: Histone transcription regulator 3 [Piccolia ochrophora]
MSAFVALNIYEDEEIDDEIEDTREIQIEEALKLYQNALKLHSQGPNSAHDASLAYRALFKSDIFGYKESRIALQITQRGSSLDDDDDDDDGELPPGVALPPDAAASSTDHSPSTLPQLLYLSFKNYGQFVLDTLKHRIEQASDGPTNAMVHETDLQDAVKEALANFSSAIVFDGTDSDLWRRTARLCGVLGSHRATRLCLEAALQEEDTVWAPPGLDQAFAKSELRALLELLADNDPHLLPLPLRNDRKRLTPSLQKGIRLYPYIPEVPAELVRDRKDASYPSVVPQTHEIAVHTPTWTELAYILRTELRSTKSTGALAYQEEDNFPSPPIRLLLKGHEGHTLLEEVGDLEHVAEPMDSIDGPDAQIQNEIAAAHSRSNSVGETTKLGTAAPTRASGSPSAEEVESRTVEVSKGVEEDRDGGKSYVAEEKKVELPTRKRTSSSAGLNETADSGRVRSKRIRARESIAEAGIHEEKSAHDAAKQFNEQQTFQVADQEMFSVLARLAQSFGLKNLDTFDPLDAVPGFAASNGDTPTDKNGHGPPLNSTIRDLYFALSRWDDESENMFLRNDPTDFSGIVSQGKNPSASRNAALTAFLDHSKNSDNGISNRPVLSDAGLVRFARQVNQLQLRLPELSLTLLRYLLSGDVGALLGERRGRRPSKASPSSYLQHSWPDSLKEHMVLMLIDLDDIVYDTVMREYISAQAWHLSFSNRDTNTDAQGLNAFTIEFAETIFELHLDIYARITNPSSIIDAGTRIAQKDRLDRWSLLAHDLLALHVATLADSECPDELSIRFLWASAVHANISGVASREHAVLCMTDLKKLFSSRGMEAIELQNNVIMPELSHAAAEREISRLTTMDFFLALFEAEDVDPILIIETLEPILELENSRCSHEDTSDRIEDDPQTEENDALSRRSNSVPIEPSQQRQVLSSFVEQGSTSLRFFLWQSLREAYEAIGYLPKVLSCYLRSLEMIVKELQSSIFLENPSKHRQAAVWKWLRVAHELLGRILPPILINKTIAFECIDRSHLASSMSAATDLAKLLHCPSAFEDRMRAGLVQVPAFSSRALSGTLTRATEKLRGMAMMNWTLLYFLFEEGMSQEQTIFTDGSKVLSEYLHRVHQATGVRGFCGSAKKVFLKCLLKNHLARSADYERDLIQVIYDLYGLKLGSGPSAPVEHGCQPGVLDRAKVKSMMTFVIKLAKRINFKDLPKAELRTAIERMQQVLGPPKEVTETLLNARVINNYLHSSIDPQAIYRCFKGQWNLSAVPVTRTNGLTAEKGWYLLLGDLHLARYRCQKRVSPTPIDDLDAASSFFRHDLQYDMDNWETWYRKAQTYDTMLEEKVLWSAMSLNTIKAQLGVLERRAVHCYVMAVSTASQLADPSFETVEKFSELFTEFGNRLYSSSRPPFSMEAFKVDGDERHFSGTHGMYRGSSMTPLSPYQAWKVANVLFRKALEQRPDAWLNYYMSGKCLWKMYNHPEQGSKGAPTITLSDVIATFVKAIETLPERKTEKQDPILEPHYKLVSIVHKLVQRKKIELKHASEILENTLYARKVPPAEDLDAWDFHVLQILKALRTADKANWHHRMIARAAHIIYDDSAEDLPAAAAAKHELSQHMFTKTMALQVWKPEFERAGRHFVYVSRYLLFFVRLLVQLNDRTSIQTLARRIRRKVSDFFEFDNVWKRVYEAYTVILRRTGRIPQDHEDVAFRSMSHDEFEANSARLELWCHAPSASDPVLDILHEATELKRLNDRLSPPSSIEALIADTYALLYKTIVPRLLQKEKAEEEVKLQEKSNMMSLNNLLMSTDGPSDTPSMRSGSAHPAPPTGVKTRFKGVSRKDVLRKAESATTKAQPSLAPTGRQGRAGDPPRTLAPAAPQAALAGVVSPPGAEEEGKVVIGSSVAGSVHDSADDESDESEEEADAAPPPMFPNLGITTGKDRQDHGVKDEA